MTLSHPIDVLNHSEMDSWFQPLAARDPFAWNAMPSSFHWLSTCAAFADSGGMASADELAQRLVDSASNVGGANGLQATALVARWIVSRSVVTVLGPHG